jgi:hypothetical protein
MEKEVESPIKLSLLFIRMSIGAGMFVYMTLSAGIFVESSGVTRLKRRCATRLGVSDGVSVD